MSINNNKKYEQDRKNMECLNFSISIFFIITIIALTGSERPKFREDYRYEKAFDAFYKVHYAAVDWTTALIRCEAESTALMVPSSLDEVDSVPLLTASILNKYQGVYVGIHDLYSERTFITINGSALLDTILDLLWEYKEPVYSGGRCVAMRRNGRLFVHPCFHPLPFICKTKAARVSYSQECDAYNPKWKLGSNGHCYITHNEPQTWYDGYATCLAAGGYLAILNNRTEADYVRDLFKNVTTDIVPDHDFAFLGFSDLFQRHHYRTVHGESIEDTGYVDWDLKCARQSGNTTGKEFRCGGIRRSGLLTTGDCNVPSIFFCEKPAKTAKVRTFFSQIDESLPRHTHTHDRKKINSEKNLQKHIDPVYK